MSVTGVVIGLPPRCVVGRHDHMMIGVLAVSLRNYVRCQPTTSDVIAVTFNRQPTDTGAARCRSPTRSCCDRVPTTSSPASSGERSICSRSCSRAGEINLTAAADRAGLTPTTALRHLRALEARGYLRRGADGTYAAGPTVLRLAAAARDDGPIRAPRRRGTAASRRVGRPHRRIVVPRRRATATSAVYLATAESSRSIRHVGWVGQDGPARRHGCR